MVVFEWVTWSDLCYRAKLVADRIVENRSTSSHTGCIDLFGVPRGGIYAALLIGNALSFRGVPVELVEKVHQGCYVIDDIIASGSTRERFQKVNHLGFYALYEKAPGDGWVVFPWERMKDESGPETSIMRILEYIGEDTEREGLLDTPKRVVRSWDTLFGGYKEDPGAVLKSFEEGACDEVVVLRDIEFYSTCEHHMLPFFGKAHIGYLPDKSVVGVSKLARLLEVFARRLQIQERLGDQITQAIMEHLSPLGCGCVLEAQHFCMTARGVAKQKSIMVTSSMKGTFLEPSIKSEFFRIISL